MRTLERRQDTRQKIQLGGLVKKAQLEHENTAVLYGLLLEAFEQLNGEHSEHFRNAWRIKGDMALTNEQIMLDKNIKSFA